MKSLEERIAELDRELAALKEERDRLNSEARKWAEKRDSIHEQIKGLRAEVADLKGKRDALNREVQSLKDLRGKAQAERREKRDKMLGLREQLRGLREERPPRDMREIEREIEGLDWKIQTSSLSLEEEKELVGRVRNLEAQLTIHRQIQGLKDRLDELQKEMEALNAEGELHHKKLSELAGQSQNFHEEMLKTLERIRVLREEADSAHQKYVTIKQQARALRPKHAELSQQIALLRQELRQAEEEREKERLKGLRRELEKRALEKWKRGEKLTLDEFKVLTEKGIL